MKPSLTREEAEAILQAEKYVENPVYWVSSGNDRQRFDIEVFFRHEHNPNAMLALRGNVGKTNYSFCLLYNNHPIRKYTKHGPHKIGSQIFREPHKHVWNGYSENQEAYIPDDIDPTQDIEAQLEAFCQECNIKIVSHY